MNRKLARLMLIALAVLCAGLLSVYAANRSDIQKYEDKPLFPNLARQINSVREIVIQNQGKTLTFTNENGIWDLKQAPGFPVYQERIRSFLSALLEARFYEKKSDKAENLSLFGLQPVEAENSPNTRIELLNENGSVIQAFEVGEYNLDLGRGSKAAYVKFDGQFQVWLADADFVDLSSNWQQWTYSHLWDLRFGRLVSVGSNGQPDDVAVMAKEFLNTAFISIEDSLQNPKLLKTLAIVAENENRLTLKFYESGKKYWAAYEFEQPVAGKHLQLFESYVKGHYLEISAESWEIIKNGTPT